MPFTADSLKPQLADMAALWIGYSGGLDSHVLLHAAATLLRGEAHPPPLKAIHVNHGISPDADAWQEHCRQVCGDLGVEFHTARLSLRAPGRDSLETRARRARYQAFADLLRPGDTLWLAHHLDDQMETLLFRLLRGAGPRGLAGIPPRRCLGEGHLARPLLEFARGDLRSYAGAHGLAWIEDASNADDAIDRNYLRHQVLPLLEARWPGYRRGWLRSARLCAEAENHQRTLARQDFERARTDHLNRLDLAPLADFDAARQRNLLRYWFDRLNQRYHFAEPDHVTLRRLVHEVLAARPDAAPRLAWGGPREGVEVRRYQGRLYALRPCGAPPAGELLWDTREPLDLGEALGRLTLVPVASHGIALNDLGPLRVRFRAGGEQAKPAGRRTRPLKKLFQDHAVPPWLRDAVPLICHGDTLVAAADLFLCEGWQREAGEGLYRIRWDRSDIHCGY